MPPRSRGSPVQGERAKQQWQNTDPLSVVVSIVLRPILLLALGILHTVFYLTIKARSTTTSSRTGHKRRTIFGADEKDAEEELKKLYERARGVGNGQVNDEVVHLKAVQRSFDSVTPRHIGLALGAKPIRTRTLLYRLMLSRVRPSKGKGNEGEEEEEEQQKRFALQNMYAAVRFCALVGIEEISVSDQDGHLARAYEDGQVESWTTEGFTVRMRIRKPFSKPYVNGLNGTHRTDDQRIRRVQVNVLRPGDGKGALAQVASLLCKQEAREGGGKAISVTEKVVDEVLRRHGYPSEPDLLLLHGGARHVSTLHGFPLWLVRLCEIFHDVDADPNRPLQAVSFLRALDAFMNAEQRFGK